MIGTETQIGWQDYLAIVARRKWFFIVPCALIVVVSLVVGLFMPRIYRAETIILAQEPNIMNPLIQGLAVSTPVQERLKTLREEILSWTSLSRLVHEVKLDQHAKSPLAFEQLIKKLQQDIDVRMNGRDLIRITYENEDPKLSQQLVNTVSSIFLERNMEAQSSETGTAIDFIDREMAVYKKKLEDSELALRRFKELYAGQMPVAQELNEQIIDMEVALTQLLVENTDEHPVVLQTRKRLSELKATRNLQIKQFIASSIARGQDPKDYEELLKAFDRPTAPDAEADPNVKMAKEAYSALVERLDTVKQAPQQSVQQIQVITDPKAASSSGMTTLATPVSISLAPWQEQELFRLSRDYDVNASTYQHLQERLERAKITQRLGESDEGLKFKVLEPARMPLKPVKPNMMKIFFFALLLGAFISTGIAFVAEYLDQSFQTADDVQAELELPVLGTISTIVTVDDVAARRRRLNTWVSPRHWKTRLNNGVKPLAQLVDRLLVKSGL